MVRQRARIRFGKQGDLRLIGHRDLVRTMERLFRRAGLRLRMSQGFHPKARMSFPSALAVGIEGLDEVMELELDESSTPEDLLRRLGSHSVPGLVFRSVEVVAPTRRKAQVAGAHYQVLIPVERRAEVADRASRLMAHSAYPIRRPHKGREIDLRRFLKGLTLEGGLLTMRLGASDRASAGPRDVLRALGLEDLEQKGALLKRTTVELQS